MTDNHNFSIQGYNLVTLLKRLEAATSRLEDVTIYQENHTVPSANKAIEKGAGDDAGGEPAAVEAAAPAPAPVAAAAEVPKSIQEFDLFIDGKIAPYVELSKKIDPVLGEQAETFEQAVRKEREVLHAAAQSKKVSVEDEAFQKLAIAPINGLIMKVISLKDDNRSSKHFNLLNAVAEGVAVLGWIVTTTPVSYIPDFKDSAQFWTNRVLKDCKGKEDEQLHVEWVKTFLGIFDELKAYVKEYQTTGISWSGSEDFGKVLERETPAAPDAAAAGAASAPAPPPPPPPPPPADFFAEETAAAKPPAAAEATEGGMGAVFAQLNKGEAITSGLKKVDKSQMTHKNPELRKKAVPMPPKKPKSLSRAAAPGGQGDGGVRAKKPPQHELVDNKWMVTNMTKADCDGVVTIHGSMDQSVYIGNCDGIVVQIRGKVNAISINLCARVGVVVDRAISSVEMTKCQRCEIQVVEAVPVINIDQSESISAYLSQSALGVELYTSCCTAVNVNVPAAGADADADLKEVAISEQLVTRFDAQGGHVTEAVVHG